MKKVYMVISALGQYEDYTENIELACFDREMAEDYKKRYNELLGEEYEKKKKEYIEEKIKNCAYHNERKCLESYFGFTVWNKYEAEIREIDVVENKEEVNKIDIARYE